VSYFIDIAYTPADFDTAVASSSEVAPPKTEFGETWKKYHPNSNILYEPNIRQALDTARSIGKEAGDLHTLITGSQHLVGGALYSLNNPVAAQTST
jgi:folylpolyglutamate synthase